MSRPTPADPSGAAPPSPSRDDRAADPSATSSDPAPAEEQEQEQGEREVPSPLNDDAPDATSTRTTRSARSQEANSLRRTSRRASLDPYPAQTDPVSERSRRSTRSRARSTQPEPDRPVERAIDEMEEQATPDAPEASAADAPTATMNGKHFELVILQQPEIGAEAGLGKVTLGRLPIIPAPVVQVVVKDDSGEILDVELPYLFCACSLRDADGTTAVNVAPSASTSRENGEMSALIGNSVRNPHRVRDLNGNTVSVFVFEDVSVRMQGSFTLEFSLGEARQAQSLKLASITSEPFDVVEWKNYPGRPAEDTVPELSMHLHKQGVPMYIPPLVMTAPASSPPPPSTNPFPLDHTAPSEPESGDPAGTTTPGP
ncbi:hypothetical protein JCM11491_003470 [Sporobolomyces phaffii]